MPVGDGVPDAPQRVKPRPANQPRKGCSRKPAGRACPAFKQFHSIHRITFVASTKSCDSYRCCAPSFWASTCSSRYSSRRLPGSRSQQLAANALPAHTCVHDQIPQTGIPVGQHTAERRRPARIVDQRKAHGGAASCSASKKSASSALTALQISSTSRGASQKTPAAARPWRCQAGGTAQ